MIPEFVEINLFPKAILILPAGSLAFIFRFSRPGYEIGARLVRMLVCSAPVLC